MPACAGSGSPLLLIFLTTGAYGVVAHAEWGHGRIRVSLLHPLDLLPRYVPSPHETLGLIDRKALPIFTTLESGDLDVGAQHTGRSTIRGLQQQKVRLQRCMASLDVPTFRIRACMPQPLTLLPSCLFLARGKSRRNSKAVDGLGTTGREKCSDQ